jgi:hypothetical protein
MAGLPATLFTPQVALQALEVAKNHGYLTAERVHYVSSSAPALLDEPLCPAPSLLPGPVGGLEQLLRSLPRPRSRQPHQSGRCLTCSAQVVLGRHSQSVRRRRSPGRSSVLCAAHSDPPGRL